MKAECSCKTFGFSYPTLNLALMFRWYWHKLRGHEFIYRGDYR